MKSLVRWLSLSGVIAALLTVATMTPLSAQNTGSIRGTVTDEDSGRPLPGVQVFIPQSGIGSLTDASGQYLLLNVPAGPQTVQAQIVGRRTAEQTVTVTAGESSVADFELRESAIELNEVVVTGAGQATEKRKLGNTIATINADQLETAPIVNVSDMLQGREPGVVGLPSSGSTGEGARFRIRGSASLSQSNEPLIYVDGVRVDRAGGFGRGVGSGGQGNPSRLDDINPESIERIEILKGAAAATLYGTEAANGVIQIFTKKGQAGEPRWSFQVEQGFIDVPTNRIEPLADFARDQEDVDRIRSFHGRNVQPFEPFVVEDALPSMFETGTNTTTSLSVSGGTQFITYFASGRYSTESGPIDSDQFNVEGGPGVAEDLNTKVQATLNLGVFPHEKIRLSFNSFYSETDHQTPPTSNNIFGLWSSALMSHPRLATENNTFGQLAFATTRENAHEVLKQEAQHYSGNLTATVEATEELNVSATFGVDFTNQLSSDFFPFGWNVDDFSVFFTDGLRDISDRNHSEITGDIKGAWNTNFGALFSSAFVIGAQGFITETESSGGEALNFPGPGLEVAEAGADQSILESFLKVVNTGVFAQEQLGYRDFAFFTVGARYDANSAFGEDFEGVLYPKASISLIPSQFAGWNSSLLSSFRLRAAIGKSGLQPGAFDKFRTFEPLASEVGAGLAPDNLGNQELKPEVSTEWEVGTELGLFDDRFALEATYWNRVVDDALVARQFPVSAGFRDEQLDNIGELKGQGVELAASGTVLNRQQVSVSLFANAQYLWQEVTSLGGAPQLKVGGSYPRYRNFIKEGFAPGAFFGAQVADVPIPIDPAKGCNPLSREAALAYFSEPRSPDDFEVVPVDCEMGSAFFLENTYIGKPEPDWQGSFGGSINFLDSWQLNTLFEFKAGNYFVQDLSGAFRRSNAVIGRNTPDAARVVATMADPASTAEERLDAAVFWSRNLRSLAPMSGMNNIFPADWVRWRELSLTYTLPSAFARRFNMNSAAITLAGRNLWLGVHDAYPGMDPEVNVLGRCNEGGTASLSCNFLNSTEGWGVPIPRRYSIAVRVGF